MSHVQLALFSKKHSLKFSVYTLHVRDCTTNFCFESWDSLTLLVWGPKGFEGVPYPFHYLLVRLPGISICNGSCVISGVQQKYHVRYGERVQTSENSYNPMLKHFVCLLSCSRCTPWQDLQCLYVLFGAI